MLVWLEGLFAEADPLPAEDSARDRVDGVEAGIVGALGGAKGVAATFVAADNELAAVMVMVGIAVNMLVLLLEIDASAAVTDSAAAAG